MSNYEKTKIFLLGFIAALLLVYFLQTNIVNASPDNSSEIGRYRLMNNAGKSTVFVIDTKTGMVKEYFINIQSAQYENIHTFKTF